MNPADLAMVPVFYGINYRAVTITAAGQYTMQHLDSDYVERIVERLEAITPDAAPRWGELRRDSLIEHLIWSVRHAMGRSKAVPMLGNWFTRGFVAPLLLWGILPIPKNLKLPNHVTAQGIVMREPGDIETLHALLEEYLNLVQADELKPAPHPVLGDLGIDGWDRLHVRHFEHHLKQFGV